MVCMKTKTHSLHILLIFLLGLCAGFILRGSIGQGVRLNAYQIEAPTAFKEVDFHLPQVAQVIHRQGYTVCYDGRTRLPHYVIETITKDSIQGDADRGSCSFQEDEAIPGHIQSRLLDYRHSGFDRGHLSPAAHHRSSQEAMQESFILSNVCPQVPQFNRGYMLKVERHISSLLDTSNEITIISGPIFQPEQREDGKSYVCYEVLGEGHTAVPHAFFKVIKLEDGDLQAYILPNEHIAPETPLEAFQVTVQKVEQVSVVVLSVYNYTNLAP